MKRKTLLLLGALLLFADGCKKIHRTDFKPLDDVGMSYSSEEEIRGLDATDAEVIELAKVKRAGISDSACVDLVHIARAQNHPFAEGDAIAGLRQAGMAEGTILELDRINQLGLQSGEEQAMRLAGLSDNMVLVIARRRAAGQSFLSGASLATLKNAGMSEATMLELLNMGIGDDRVSQIVALKSRGKSDSAVLEILRGPKAEPRPTRKQKKRRSKKVR